MLRQLRLLTDDERYPRRLPEGRPDYVPVLQTLLGELRALGSLADTSWARITPLVEVNVKNGDTDDAPSRSSLAGLPGRLASVVGERSFFLDFPWLSSSKRISVGRGARRRSVLAAPYMVEQCLLLGLNFVPVIDASSDPRRINLVREAAEDGRGASIRWAIGNTFAVVSPERELGRLLDALGASPSDTDLFLDLGEIADNVGYYAEALKAFLELLPWLWEWRRLVLLGTVIPPTLANFAEGGITVIHRREWHLWREIRDIPFLRVPTFGDYGVQNPKRPTRGGRGMRANIRYSTGDKVLIARGRLREKFDAQDYRELCRLLIQHPEFQDSAYSWGDNEIVLCAQGAGDPGTQQKWRGVGASHHIRATLDAIAALTKEGKKASTHATARARH